MDIETIINEIKLANYNDQVVEKLVRDINAFNLESKSETIEKLKARRGTLPKVEDNQAIEELIARLEG